MLRYRIEGSGIPLLLIHGWGVTYTIWKNLAPLLSPQFQLIMIELPGNGGSPGADPQLPYYPACAEAIEEVRRTLAIEQWSVLAYSSGTRAAEAYVQHYPQRIARTVFLCPIYLPEWWSLSIRFLGKLENIRHHEALRHWLLSDWRLYGLVSTLAFNGRITHYTHEWKNEIELQHTDNLMRMLYELPGVGRAPFEVPSVPALFIWGRRDVLTARPRRQRPNDVVIPANHGAPILAATNIAEVVLPFLTEGKLLAKRSRWQRWRPEWMKDPQHADERTQLLRLIRKASRLPFILDKEDLLKSPERSNG